MGEKSKSEPEALPVRNEIPVKEEAGEKPQERVARGDPAACSNRWLLIGGPLLILSVAAASAGVALFWSSRAAFNRSQRAAFEELQQSLQRVEEHITASETRARSAAAGVRPLSSTPEGSGLLDAANLRFREGQFQEAAGLFRAALDMNMAGSFSDETHYRYAQSLLKTGQFDRALVEFQTIEASFPGSSYFASAAMEAAQLLFQKKSYSQARRVLYELMAARDRLGPADKASVERAYFFVAQCYEAEAESLEGSTHSPLSRPPGGGLASAAVVPTKTGTQPPLPVRNTQTEGK